MRLSTVIIAHDRWHGGGRATWHRAEQLGFHAAYTYDHLSWRSFRDRPWWGAVPTLTAAAAVTERIRLGTMVTSPNFRHPVTLAKDLVGLDDVSGGRVTLGIGAGGTGYDATAMGQQAWSRSERTRRFEEFVTMLDRLLREPEGVTQRGEFYAADEVRNLPGCVQQPRLPFAVAATGPRGLALAARYGQAWVTTGDDSVTTNGTPAQSLAALRGQLGRLDEACTAAGRDPAELDRILLAGFTPEQQGPLASLAAFDDFAGAHAELGFTELVLHWPVADSIFAADPRVFEQIAVERASG
ncbi:LLM class flavin-dependent oxidoreductase [Nocardioides terrisoli]|uniref:LLM class flavin-dependent oxidoreductase n=1 Tax=Nocardioides terrisoli TaxID=3388267 RepID=UPI00287BA102|nr:LLM class flavin-dependent oxidoreductase [Nocardioides marmorisolisilvae]